MRFNPDRADLPLWHPEAALMLLGQIPLAFGRDLSEGLLEASEALSVAAKGEHKALDALLRCPEAAPGSVAGAQGIARHAPSWRAHCVDGAWESCARMPHVFGPAPVLSKLAAPMFMNCMQLTRARVRARAKTPLGVLSAPPLRLQSGPGFWCCLRQI